VNKVKNEKQIAQVLIKVFSKNESIKGYFKSNIDWLNDRMSQWEKNYIRVGLVGVTSSGKSTLLNAILGDDILPTAVRPTSGTLITCSKGKYVEAVVYFENGTFVNIPKNQLREKIQIYGDERFNENNKYKVKIINVKSPNFLFPEKIQIIDSPGLDAHGLEKHEQITMEMLLPTVDLCMYVVTLKANSDSITREILHTIYEHQKPLIIIQNMLDSVEPKIGKGGEVLKTKDQVAREHIKRIERILKSIDPNLNEIVNIVQLSAKRAVDGRRESDCQKIRQSKFNILVDNMKEHEKIIRPKLYVERTNQILRHLTSIQEREEKIVGDVETLEKITSEQERELQYLHDKQKQLNDKTVSAREILMEKLVQLEKETSATINKIEMLDNEDTDSCTELLNYIRDEAKTIEKAFIANIRDLNGKVSDFLELLNLQSKDYENDILPKSVRTQHYFSVKKKIIQEEHRRKKSGLGNKIARFFGDFLDEDWGYEYQTKDVEVIDFQAISKGLNSYQQKLSHSFYGFIDQWQNRLGKFLTKAKEEVQRQSMELEQKRSNLLEQQEMVAVLEDIKRVVRTVKGEEEFKRITSVKSQKKTQAKETTKDYSQVSIQEETFYLFKLSYHFLNLHFKKCWELVQREDRKYLKNLTRTLIWGWDTHSLLSYSERYLNITFSTDEEKKLENNGMVIPKKNNKLLFVNEQMLHPQVFKELKLLLQNGNYNIYVLIHLIQSGQARKRFIKSLLYEMPNCHKIPINCVIQSIQEFKEGRNLDEAVRVLYELICELNLLKKGKVLVNDKNPLYSMASLQLNEPKTIIADAQEFLHNIKVNYQYLTAIPGEEDHIRSFIKALIDCRGGIFNEQICND